MLTSDFLCIHNGILIANSTWFELKILFLCPRPKGANWNVGRCKSHTNLKANCMYTLDETKHPENSAYNQVTDVYMCRIVLLANHRCFVCFE